MSEVWNSMSESLNTRSIRLPGVEALLSTAIYQRNEDAKKAFTYEIPNLRLTRKSFLYVRTNVLL